VQKIAFFEKGQGGSLVPEDTLQDDD